MWDAQKVQRFQLLRALPEPRSATDQAELDALIRELEAVEAAYLSDATRRLGNEREQIEARNRRLESLLARRRSLAERLENTLAEVKAERRAIESELATVLSPSQSGD
jgi:hypothetical protein